jgi:amidohydrolase
MIFGLHVDPNVATGKIGLRDGVTMASVTDFDVVIRGRGGHAARPHETVDAVVIAGELIPALQTIVSREIDPLSPVAITLGRIEGGAARNVVADRVTIAGTARALSEKTARELPRRIKRTVQSVCRARGAKGEVTFQPGYPVLENHPRVNGILRKNFTALFGKGRVVMTPQVLGGEDFARYLQSAPGAQFRLGVRNRKIGAVQPWHSPKFLVDEQALVHGTALLCAASLEALADGSS